MRLYCSEKCRRSKKLRCKECGAGFVAGERAAYCSAKCACAKRIKGPVEKTCPGCGAAFSAARRSSSSRVYCTPECRSRTWKISRTHDCIRCGSSFLPRPRTSGKFCSRDCAFESLKAGHPAAREPQKVQAFSRSHRQRCLLYEVPYEPVTRRFILDRDGWRCGICGVELLRKQERDPETGRLDDRCPTIDHIVPISAGPGSPGHVASNLRAACRRCNMDKGAAVLHSFAGP
jgi:5-methylcytosine-specific restriction endonuclease McrA